MIEKVRWSGQTSQNTLPPPSSTKWYFPTYEHALYKGDFANGNGELWRHCWHRLLLKTTAPLLFAIKITVKHATFVSDTLFSELHVMRVFVFYFSQLIAKVRHYISAYCYSQLSNMIDAGLTFATTLELIRLFAVPIINNYWMKFLWYPE